MKLFLDTSNSFFSIALIEDNKVSAFLKIKAEKNIVKMTNQWIEDFFAKNNISFLEIDGFYLTIGPGSFTGSKVGLNIIKTFCLIKEINFFGIIDSFELQRTTQKFSILKVGKNKYAYKKYGFFSSKKIKITNEITKFFKKSFVYDNEKFDQLVLNEKIHNQCFKIIDNLDIINPIYLEREN